MRWLLYKLTNITDNAKQSLIWAAPNSDRITITLDYRENCLGWFLGIQYGNSVNYQNIRITNTYNLLRSYNSYIPYGIRIETLDGLEPMAKDDFSSGYASIYMLTEEECNRTESEYYGKV